MKKCPQTNTQNVYEHGLSVRDYLFKLIDFLKGEPIPDSFRIPSWFIEYREKILEKLFTLDILEEYTVFHDCGKPYCRIIDSEGKQHFPNHAEVSYNIWLDYGGKMRVANLIRNDMIIHTMKAADIDDFIKMPEAISLLITGLAEIHSNASMFGGIDSTSFKIKYGQIDKRGKAICKKLFDHSLGNE